MGKSLSMEKNSCRALVYKCKLLPDHCCQPCKDALELSVGYLADHRELWNGVCHRLHFPDLMNQDSEQAATSKRSRHATVRYEATPSKGKMLYMFNDASPKRASPKRESEKKTKMNALQAISNLQDRDFDRAIASRYVAAADDRHADKENKKRKISWCSLPNGGQSKAAVNKQKKLAGQVFNGMAKQIGGSNANDFREEAMDSMLKQAPFLMWSPSKSSFEQAAPTSAAHAGSADKATTDDHSEELGVQDSSHEATTGNSPSRVSNKKIRGRMQRLTKSQERLKLEIGTSLIADLQKMEKNEERRPILACHTEYTKDDLERVSDSCMSSTYLCYFKH
jgi:hypothetical protein